jgi:hypothetical protein
MKAIPYHLAHGVHGKQLRKLAIRYARLIEKQETP